MAPATLGTKDQAHSTPEASQPWSEKEWRVEREILAAFTEKIPDDMTAQRAHSSDWPGWIQSAVAELHWPSLDTEENRSHHCTKLREPQKPATQMFPV